MLPIVKALLGNGLSLIANAVLAKGTAFVKEKTGIDLDKSQLSEKDLTDLKKYEMEHEEELMKLRLEENKLDVALAKFYLADTQDARDREGRMAESQYASWLNKNAGPALGIITIVLTFGMFYLVLYGTGLTRSTEHKDIIIYILGVLSAVVTQIFSYYFGSSQGSKAKSESIDKIIARGSGGQS